MPILPNGVKNFTPQPEGGSPRGNTFISAFLGCWRAGGLRYIAGLIPVTPSEALMTGIAYHALLEGDSEEEVRAAHPEYAVEAIKMFKERLKGPPLPSDESVIIEKEFSIFGGLMTSKPDRIEGKGENRRVRDFKTSAMFREDDELAWNIDPGILGECIAGKTTKAIVDIQKKYAPEKNKDGTPYDGKTTKIVTVHLTPEKHEALEVMVRGFWDELERRVKATAEGGDPKFTFPKSLKGCVTRYGLCPYYARCWQKGKSDFFLYKLTEQPPDRWALYPPKVKWLKELAAAAKVLRKL